MTDTVITTKTRAICRVPLVGCLEKAKEYKSLASEWESINDEQRDFLRHVRLASELKNFNKEEFDSIAADNATIINKWLSDNGFTLTCPEVQPGDFATASFVKMFVKWIKDGDKTVICNADSQYPAVSFNNEIGKNIHHMGANWGVACLSTKEDNTKVYCAMRTDADTDFDAISEEHLVDLAAALESNYTSAPKSYEGVNVPMLDMDIDVEQNWICGINNSGWSVSTCIQQFILKFNEKGATAKSAAVMLIKRAMVMPSYQKLVFNKPFLLWFSRDGLTYPAFLAVCGTDCWKEPANLD